MEYPVPVPISPMSFGGVPSIAFVPRSVRLAGRKRRRAGRTTFVPRKKFKQTGFRKRRSRNFRTGGFLGIELKFYDTSLSAAALTAPTDSTGGEHNPSATIALNTVVQGDGESNRDGKNIVMKKLHIQGTIDVPGQINQTIQDTAPIVYIAVVLDKQSNGALFATENVFKNTGANAKLAGAPMRNLQFIKRFQILKSRRIQLPQAVAVYDGTNIEQGGFQVPFEMHIELGGITTDYSNTTETIANITNNSLNIAAFCTSTGYAPTLSYNARLRFVG